ncbi:MAG: hypothetical protein CVU38_13755 [Chloroflexi bacterium HGW-Chloroflexi-1]|nr:MAG: hypothetical protein CVU38_13755 [Chloroflexi bacterium HGW-Chloroflexi-1]
MRSKQYYLVDALLLLGLCLLFFWRDLTPVLADRWGFAPGDFTDQFYAFARYEATRLQNGQLPLWNPYTFAGHPFLADIQSAVFYPLSLLTMLLTSFKGFFYRALELEAIAHFFLAALFTYLFARRLTRSRIGGLVAATVFTFSGYLTSYPPLQLAILETQVWLPLILLLLELAAARLTTGARAAAVRWCVVAGLVFGIALLAGHPQSGLLVTYGSLAYGLFRFWPRPFAWRWRTWGWPIGLLALFGLVGLGAAAVQILPSWEFLALSTRSGIGFEEAGRGFTPYDLVQLVFPQVGGAVPALYVGILPLGLIPLALLAVRRDPTESEDSRRIIAFLGWGLLVAVLLSCGKFLGLYFFAYLFVPGWKLFRGQERTIVWAVLAGALLCGYGAAWLNRRWVAARTGSAVQSPAASLPDRLLQGATGSPESSLALGFGLAALAALILAFVFLVGYLGGNDRLWGFTAASLALVVFLFLALLAVRSGRVVWLLVVIVVDLFTFNPAHHAGPIGQAELDKYRAFLSAPMADTGIFRVSNDNAVPGNYGLLYRIEDIRGSSPLQLQAYNQFLELVPVERGWWLLNVKYVLSWRQYLEIPAERLAEMEGPEKKPIYVYQLSATGPRAWLVGQVIVAPDQALAWQRLAAPDFDPARQVVLSAQPAGFGTEAACDGQITWRKREPEHLALSVITDKPCILVLGELYYPGWQATVDDASVPILSANVILRAVTLSSGQHEVSFTYRPASVRWGALITLVTVIVAVAWLALSLMARRK